MKERFPQFKAIVADNEFAAQQALAQKNYVQAFLLIHALVESLLRQFLRETGDKPSFAGLIEKYEEFLLAEGQSKQTFVDELTQFNRRRNRLVHNLWHHGYTLTNKWAEQAAGAAIVTYGLLIEWMETFNPDITEQGFENN